MNPEKRRLFGLGLLLARPAAGEVGESLSPSVIHGRARGTEYRSLEGGGGDQLAPRRHPVLGLRGLLFVDQAPDLLEDLLAEKAGDQAADDAEWDEQKLHLRRGIPPGPVG